MHADALPVLCCAYHHLRVHMQYHATTSQSYGWSVVLLCGTRSRTAAVRIRRMLCVYTYHQHVLSTIPSPTALVAARGDVSDVAPHDALLLYGLWSRAVYTYHQHVLCTDIPLTVHVAHPLLCGDIAAHSMLLRIRLQLPNIHHSCRGRYHRADPW